MEKWSPGSAPVSELPRIAIDVGSRGSYCFHPDVCGPFSGSLDDALVSDCPIHQRVLTFDEVRPRLNHNIRHPNLHRRRRHKRRRQHNRPPRPHHKPNILPMKRPNPRPPRIQITRNQVEAIAPDFQAERGGTLSGEVVCEAQHVCVASDCG